MSTDAIEGLKSSVRGKVILPDSPNYDDVRKIWNAVIDRRPAIIVQCADASDARYAIGYARDNGLESPSAARVTTSVATAYAKAAC